MSRLTDVSEWRHFAAELDFSQYNVGAMESPAACWMLRSGGGDGAAGAPSWSSTRCQFTVKPKLFQYIVTGFEFGLQPNSNPVTMYWNNFGFTVN